MKLKPVCRVARTTTARKSDRASRTSDGARTKDSCTSTSVAARSNSAVCRHSTCADSEAIFHNRTDEVLAHSCNESATRRDSDGRRAAELPSCLMQKTAQRIAPASRATATARSKAVKSQIVRGGKFSSHFPNEKRALLRAPVSRELDAAIRLIPPERVPAAVTAAAPARRITAVVAVALHLNRTGVDQRRTKTCEEASRSGARYRKSNRAGSSDSQKKRPQHGIPLEGCSRSYLGGEPLNE